MPSCKTTRRRRFSHIVVEKNPAEAGFGMERKIKLHKAADQAQEPRSTGCLNQGCRRRDHHAAGGVGCGNFLQ